MKTDDATPNRYASDWNSYSAAWDTQFGSRYRHLGDEWCDEGTAERRHENRVFAIVEPWLRPSARALEIGPGGGKWTVRLAPRVSELVVFDVADAMLARTRIRCEQQELANIRYVLGERSGAIDSADDSLDLVFSYDVFVHITLEDTVHYVGEIARALRPGGVAIVHHAINDVAPAWDRIASHNDWYRSGATLGQYYYHSAAALRHMYERAGFVVLQTSTEYCTTILTVQKPVDAVAARIELALRRAVTAADQQALDGAVDEVARVAADIQRRLATLLEELAQAPSGQRRDAVVHNIRRLMRA